jgi:hypothetical protein
MATPITGGTAFDFGAAAQAEAPPQAARTPTAPVGQLAKIEPTEDTVKLSPGAQVRLLKTQGQSVAQIVVNTALSTQTVNSYLGITQSVPTPGKT